MSDNKRPYRSHYSGMLRAGYCKSAASAAKTAYTHLVNGEERKATIEGPHGTVAWLTWTAAPEGEEMKIIVEEQFPGRWVAVTEDYTGPPGLLGTGPTAGAAAADLMIQLARRTDVKDDVSYGGTE